MTALHSDTDSISVVICAYTQARWDELVAAVDSVTRQSLTPREIIVVVDHNSELYRRVCAEIPGVNAVENGYRQGLSGARNTGIDVASGAVIAFMDEDAVAVPGWLEQLARGYTDADVLGVGGAIEPDWRAGRPRWFPDEFDWVVGCTYRGMPERTAPIRNLIGCNMSFRRHVFLRAGGFQHGIGRIGTRPVGCEETEMCIRVGQQQTGGIFLYEPRARVRHRVPEARATFRYFVARCYSEGLSKALISRYVGSKDGLAAERTYALRTLPRGILTGLSDALTQRDLHGIRRASMIAVGLALTTAGYMVGNVAHFGAAIHEKTRKRAAAVRRLSRLLRMRKPARPAGTAAEMADFQARRFLEVEISRALPALPALDEAAGGRCPRAVALVRLHDQPIGMVEFDLTRRGVTPDEFTGHIWAHLSAEIRAHLQDDGLPEIETLPSEGIPHSGAPACCAGRERALREAPLVTVIVATRDRPESLQICLDSILRSTYPNYEVLVVDNAPGTDATKNRIQTRYGDAPRIGYLREARAGLANAHNCGLRHARGEWIVITDDDVIVDRHWLAVLVNAFRVTDNVGCVTGLIVPQALETPAQMWLEQYGGYNRGFRRRIFDLTANRPADPLFPYTAGRFGSGANMAFSAAALRAIGGFDGALGAGTKAMGGDDLAAFFQIIAAGYRLVYEPAAVVHHAHRRAYGALRRQAFGYGVGLGAYLTKLVVDDPLRMIDFARRMPQGLRYLLSSRSPKNAGKKAGYPGELTIIERRGMLAGPFAYLRSRRHHARIDGR